MTDSQFTKLLRRTAIAGNKFLALRREAEDEYERRYGIDPSSADDDGWIDSMTGSSGELDEENTAEKVEQSAVNYAKLEPYILKP